MTIEECEIVACNCCGRLIRDTAEENTDFGVIPNPHDNGFGTCVECGGDKNSSDLRKQLGWGMVTYIEARFDVVRNGLNPEHQARWDGFSWERKVLFVLRCIDKGYFSW